ELYSVDLRHATEGQPVDHACGTDAGQPANALEDVLAQAGPLTILRILRTRNRQLHRGDACRPEPGIDMADVDETAGQKRRRDRQQNGNADLHHDERVAYARPVEG